MIDLIYDCDITMGLPGRDVDDGLALLYLLGSSDIRLRGITSTFGNSSIEEVHPCLLRVLADLGRTDLPAYKGASRDAIDAIRSSPHELDARSNSDAARFLAETVRSSPGKVSVLATGSPTNLLGAYRLHPGFFNDVKQIVFMGGITEPLMINGREMEELNFASDPQAALYALYAGLPPVGDGHSAEAPVTYRPGSAEPAGCPVVVISGNLCLQALLSRKRFDAFHSELVDAGIEGFASYLKKRLIPWFDWIEKLYGISGFHAWDATAALYLTNPQLFEPRRVLFRSRLDDLKRGILRIDDPAGSCSGWYVDIPGKIRDLSGYWKVLFDAWHAVGTDCLE
jgi:inosine-uridine nucleoside N-ribohydrolase